jgi:hypothetical protein
VLHREAAEHRGLLHDRDLFPVPHPAPGRRRAARRLRKAAARATAEEAQAFVERLNKEFRALGNELAAAGWVQATYITPDTQLLNAHANERYLERFSRADPAPARTGEWRRDIPTFPTCRP